MNAFEDFGGLSRRCPYCRKTNIGLFDFVNLKINIFCNALLHSHGMFQLCVQCSLLYVLQYIKIIAMHGPFMHISHRLDYQNKKTSSGQARDQYSSFQLDI